MNIDNNNYELCLLRYAEQELSSDEAAEVERWLATHPDAAEKLTLYSEAPRLQRNEAVRYHATIKRQPLPLWQKVASYAAAAAVIAALMLPGLRTTIAPETSPVQIASNNIDIVDIAQEADLSIEESKQFHQTERRLPVAGKRPYETEPAVATNTDIIASIPTNPYDESPLAANADEAGATDNEETMPSDTLSATTPIYVDDLIVFADDEASPIEEPSVNEEYLHKNTGGINPIAHFIGTFIKISY